MHNWNYVPDHPITLTLASDARISPTDYTNDQIWELKLTNTEIDAISVETTFGLRARLCRIFPRFTFNGKVVDDPALFSQTIRIQRYYPNYLELSFKPISGINVKIEYWVPGSQVIAGRILMINTTQEKVISLLELAEHLIPSSDGFRMTESEIDMSTILVGKTSNLTPLLFLTGGAQAGKSPYPSLQLIYTIPPMGEQEAYWAHASLSDVDSSFVMAKEVIRKNWFSEIARVTRENSKQVGIYTGNKEWDTTFYLSQNYAYQLLLQPIKHCNSISNVAIRDPDHGFSLLGNGTDYNHQWNGQSPLESLYLANFLLPSYPDIMTGLLDNFLDIQTPQGEIDLKPGLAGQRSHLLATPLFAHIALRLYTYSKDLAYLEAVFPKLLTFFYSWFTNSHDRDNDFYPEWDQAAQTGFDDLPYFSLHHQHSLGIEISTLESPSLCSYLYNECISLISIAKILNHDDPIIPLETYAMNLKLLVEQSWNDHNASYIYRDRDSHVSTTGEALGTIQGSGIIEINTNFPHAIRPIFYIESRQGVTHPAKIYIHGISTSDTHRVENITPGQIHWHLGKGYVTGAYTYNMIEFIEIIGIHPDDTLTVNTVDYSLMDQSLLLPLWAGIPSKERAKILVNLTIMNKNKYFGPFGLRTWLEFPKGAEPNIENNSTYLPWTALILEGLVRYGERSKAAEIFVRLMKSLSIDLRKDKTSDRLYQNKTRFLFGSQNSLHTLIPQGLFLRILGVEIFDPYTVEISGNNPFPWPVTVQYQGLTVIKKEKQTIVSFPDGQTYTIQNDHLQRISCNQPN
jgi:hypothetical protein